MSARILVTGLGLTLLAACADIEPGISDEPPTAPSKEDSPGYQVTAKHWLLVGDALTPGDAKFTATVKAPSDVSTVDLWIDGHYVASAQGHGTFTLEASATQLAIGEHTALLAKRGSSTAFAAVKITRSASNAV